MPTVSTNFAWKHEYDVKLWRHKQRTPNTNYHHLPLNETPPWKFSVYATEWEWEIDERNLKIMKLTNFILKGYKILGKKSSSVNIRFAAKTSNIRNLFQNIRSGNTDAYHPSVHIRKVPALWRVNYTSIDTVGSSNAKLVSMLAEHGNTQLLL